MSPDHGPASVTLIAGSKRRSLLIAGDDDKIFMTRSLNVTPKTTEHKSVAYVTNKDCARRFVLHRVGKIRTDSILGVTLTNVDNFSLFLV